MDYAGPILVNVSEQCKDTIESIQYHSMIQILKEQPGASQTEIRKKLKIDTLNNRNNTLKKNILKNH